MNQKHVRSTFKNPAPFQGFFTQFESKVGTAQKSKLPIRAYWNSSKNGTFYNNPIMGFKSKKVQSKISDQIIINNKAGFKNRVQKPAKKKINLIDLIINFIKSLFLKNQIA